MQRPHRSHIARKCLIPTIFFVDHFLTSRPFLTIYNCAMQMTTQCEVHMCVLAWVELLSCTNLQLIANIFVLFRYNVPSWHCLFRWKWAICSPNWNWMICLGNSKAIEWQHRVLILFGRRRCVLDIGQCVHGLGNGMFEEKSTVGFFKINLYRIG